MFLSVVSLSLGLLVSEPSQLREAPDDGSGLVELQCEVAPEGRLANCRVLSEEPVGQGFGSAAVSAAHSAPLSPDTAGELPVGRQVRFKVRFRLADEAGAATNSEAHDQ